MDEDNAPWRERYYFRDLTWTYEIREARLSPREKYVAKTEVDYVFGGKPMMVSTVFLMIDHGYDDAGPPILFETMVFNTRNGEDYSQRYYTELEARCGHAQTVRMVNLHGIRRCTDVLEREIAKGEAVLGR